MVKEAASKINRVGPRHTLYLQKDLVEDTAFPFLLNEPLAVKVEGERLVIERAGMPGHAGSDFIVGEKNGSAVVSILGDLGYAPVLSRAESESFPTTITLQFFAGIARLSWSSLG